MQNLTDLLQQILEENKQMNILIKEQNQKITELQNDRDYIGICLSVLGIAVPLVFAIFYQGAKVNILISKGKSLELLY